jgi:hypothetical protein
VHARTQLTSSGSRWHGRRRRARRVGARRELAGVVAQRRAHLCRSSCTHRHALHHLGDRLLGALHEPRDLHTHMAEHARTMITSIHARTRSRTSSLAAVARCSSLNTSGLCLAPRDIISDDSAGVLRRRQVTRHTRHATITQCAVTLQGDTPDISDVGEPDHLLQHHAKHLRAAQHVTFSVTPTLTNHTYLKQMWPLPTYSTPCRLPTRGI